MKNFSEFLKESVFDETPTAKLTKQIIDGIKVWIKTIKKSKGRVKFDSKTGKVTLPEGNITIFCPIPEYVSFESTNVSNQDELTIYNPSDNDLNKLDSLQYKYININGQRNSITHIPKKWDNLHTLSILGLNNNIDLSNLTQTIRLNIKYINKKINISGIENIKRVDYIVIDGGKYGISVDGVFSKLDAATINMTNVKCNYKLFKKLKKVTCDKYDFGVTLKDCIVDLSNIGYIDHMSMTVADFKPEFLPKQIDELTINGDANCIDILSGIDSDINKIFVCDNINNKTSLLSSNILKDKDSIDAISSLNKCMLNIGYHYRYASSDKLPTDLLEYFRKKAKEIKILEYKDNHHYMLFSKDLQSMIYTHNSKGCRVYYDEFVNPPAWRSTNKDTSISIEAHSDDYIFQLSGISIEVAKLITEELI